MKVNTDGVLLGAAVTLDSGTRNILDIGTGTGTIALMIAQRMEYQSRDTDSVSGIKITGIDIDPDSASEAGDNFRNSPWKSYLNSENTSLRDYAVKLDASRKFDLIISNPPYFENSLKAPDKRRSDARHTDSLSYREIIDFSAAYLSDNGILAMILPSSSERDLTRYALSSGLHLFRILRIRTTPRKEASRIIAEFSVSGKRHQEEEFLSIHSSDGNYSPEYEILTKEFLTIF